MDAETQDSYSKIPWKTVMIVFTILIVLTIGYIQVSPQSSFRFLIYTAIAIVIGFVFLAVFALNKKWRVKFREYTLNYQTRTQRPSSSRYRKAQIFFLVMFISFTILGLVLANNLTIIHNQYVQYMFLAFLVAFLVSFIVYITYLLKTFWKWGLILIMIAVAVAVIRILFR
jgi:hypothetical protein